MQYEGWLFDVDELGPEIALWIYTAGGMLVRLIDRFRAPVYVHGEQARLKTLARELDRRSIITGVRWRERQEFWSGKPVRVLELHITDSSLMPQLRKLAASHDHELTFYNCDIPAAQHYLYLKKLFPLCRLSCEADEANNVIAIEATDSPWEAVYRLPQMRIMKMRGERMRPPGDNSRIILECGEKQRTLYLRDGLHTLRAFTEFVERNDPDVILSERGDALLMPALLAVARKNKYEIMIDRDRVVTRRKIQTEGRTYFSYGRIIFKGPSYPLFGRWHIDCNNSFLQKETGLHGLVELSRLAKIPVQRMARTSPGSAMTSMEMDLAVNNGILVPWHKSEPESYKTALELLTVDKGGLVFQPPVGSFENIAEIDFASMYPSIMLRHNISPETVLCSCCDNSAVPEAGYNVCQKRRGLIPRTLEPLLERRRLYKKLKKESPDEGLRDIYDSRQTAIKWMLVCCFGYLGYKNARFGRIEAHESVTAYGRDKLLKAKEMAEAAGFQVLHAITDSLWLKREGATEGAVLKLCDEITRETVVEMSLEGIYHWIEFLPSKVNENRPVAARYYGVFTDGRIKLRGLACRRSDTPQFIKEAQMEMLQIVAQAKTLEERARLTGEVHAVLQRHIAQLESGEVDPRKLILKRTLTKEIDDYSVTTRTAVAARQLRDAGIRINPGERVQYVITNARAKDKSARVQAGELELDRGYDAQEYIKLLNAAAAEVLRAAASGPCK